jgi:hypothetical protein
MRIIATASVVTAIFLLTLSEPVYAQGVFGQCYIVLNDGTQVHVRAGDSNEEYCFRLEEACTPAGTSGKIHYNSSPILIQTPYRECSAIAPVISGTGNYQWVYGGPGDCGGHDFACSPGGNPQSSQCSGGNVVAVCWNGAPNSNFPAGMSCGGDPSHWCTYKSVSQCSGGINTGTLYYCKPKPN